MMSEEYPSEVSAKDLADNWSWWKWRIDNAVCEIITDAYIWQDCIIIDIQHDPKSHRPYLIKLKDRKPFLMSCIATSIFRVQWKQEQGAQP